MQEYDIELGEKELYTLKNQSFNINNVGSADLQVDNIKLSSDNIDILYTTTPFYIIQNNSFNFSGYLKIINFNDSTRIDYIECDVSQTNELNEKIYDVYRYYLNYTGMLTKKYVQTFKINNINYIKDLLLITIEFNNELTDQNYPNMIIFSIDNIKRYIFPKIYRISKHQIVYVYNEKSIKNLIIDDHIQMNIIYNNNSLDTHKIAYRSI